MALLQAALPRKHHPLWFSRQKGSGAALQGYGGLLIHRVLGTDPASLLLPPVYKFIKYPRGSQSLEAGEDRKVIHIADHAGSPRGSSKAEPASFLLPPP